jgi:hypothetical protein
VYTNFDNEGTPNKVSDYPPGSLRLK